MEGIIIAAIAVSLAAFFTVYLSTPPLIQWLQKKGFTVPDVNKPGKVMIARPGGISIIAGIITSCLVLYGFLPIAEILAVLLVAAGAFVVGILDDLKARGGWFKPIGLAVASAPIVIFGTYDSALMFPLFGSVQIPILYFGVIIMTISLTGNTINSIDVNNGVASGFMVMASTALTISLIIMQNYEMAVLGMMLAFTSLGFYVFHKHPSKIFPGDSGALVLGSTYGAIAIVGGVEVIAAVALLPAVINSFLFLSSTRRIVEFKKIKAKSVDHTDDLKLRATGDKNAPISLVSLIVAAKPLTEPEVVREIFKLAAFSSALAVVTALLGVWK